MIRDVFIANMQDVENQRELLKETRSAKKALEVAMNIEMGIQNQLKMSGTVAYSTSNQIANISINIIQNACNRYQPSTSNFVKPTIPPNCGYGWSATHSQNYPTGGKNCKNCGIANQFAKVFRKTKQQMKPKLRINNVDDTIPETTTVGTSATTGEKVNHIENKFQNIVAMMLTTIPIMTNMMIIVLL